jgi:hypothetical protein
MNKNTIIVVLVVIILVVGGYFFFVKQGSAPATTPTPTASQPNQTPVVYTDPSSFAPSFSQCSSSEFKTAFPGNNATFVITVLGVENGKCHYTVKIVDQNGVAIQGGPPGVDCKVPKELMSDDVLGHLFGMDTAPGKEQTLAEQTKIETDYCNK